MGRWGLGSSNGKWLGCGFVGKLAAEREARGVEEGWVVEAIDGQDVHDGLFRLRNAAASRKEGPGGKSSLCCGWTRR